MPLSFITAKRKDGDSRKLSEWFTEPWSLMAKVVTDRPDRLLILTDDLENIEIGWTHCSSSASAAQMSTDRLPYHLLPPFRASEALTQVVRPPPIVRSSSFALSSVSRSSFRKEHCSSSGGGGGRAEQSRAEDSGLSVIKTGTRQGRASESRNCLSVCLTD